jgi:hypothetical protein
MRQRFLQFAALAAVLSIHPLATAAGGGDAAISSGVEKVMAGDFAQNNFGEAKRKLGVLLDKCKKTSCAPPIQAQVDMAIGMVAAALGQTDAAKSTFIDAITLDPSTTLPPQASVPTQAIFAEALKVLAATPPPAAPHNDKTSFEFATAAIAAEVAQKYDLCIEKGKASLAIEDEPHTRLQLASCESHAGKLIGALTDAQKALDAGINTRDQSVIRPSRALVEQLLNRLPHVRFVPPENIPDLQVQFDGIPVPAQLLSKAPPADPGKHTIHASGTVNGLAMEFDQTYDVHEGEVVSVPITLKPAGPKFVTVGQMQCIRDAKSQEEVQLCMPHATRPLLVIVGLDYGSYTDTTAVNVYSPMFHANVSSPTSGWKASATYSVDVVSAASADIVSTASPPFHDTRQAASVGGGYKPGRFGAEARASLSVESDYVSRSGGAALTGDFADKRFTPRFGYNYNDDTIGRAGTPFSFFSHEFRTNEFEATGAVVLSPVALLLVGATAAFERGDQSKPYRLVPMFDTGVNEPIGASTASVNRDRLPIQPYEQLPLARDRYALGGRLAYRLGLSTLRVEERVYVDTWEQLASTTDARLLRDFGRRVLAGPHVRFNVQNGANFYHRVYHAVTAPELALPIFRTTDRELAPLVEGEAGANVRWELSPEASKIGYALVGSGDVMYTRYLNSLYISNRLAFFGTAGIEVVFE